MMRVFRNCEPGFWLLTLVALTSYMFFANETGLRVRTVGEWMDAMFYLSLAWLIRSAVDR